MGLWIELGIFGLALAFGLWQIHDVKKAREATRRQREQEREQEQELERLDKPGGSAPPPT